MAAHSRNPPSLESLGSPSIASSKDGNGSRRTMGSLEVDVDGRSGPAVGAVRFAHAMTTHTRPSKAFHGTGTVGSRRVGGRR